MTTTPDRLGRPLGSLRLSVTDRCNMRCRYCMPEDEYVWLLRATILTFEELVRLARVFGTLGSRKVRLTGGEPLLRHDLPDLVRMLANEPVVEDLALTTNGLLLAPQAEFLRQVFPCQWREAAAAMQVDRDDRRQILWQRSGPAPGEGGNGDG